MCELLLATTSAPPPFRAAAPPELRPTLTGPPPRLRDQTLRRWRIPAPPPPLTPHTGGEDEGGGEEEAEEGEEERGRRIDGRRGAGIELGGAGGFFELEPRRAVCRKGAAPTPGGAREERASPTPPPPAATRGRLLAPPARPLRPRLGAPGLAPPEVRRGAAGAGSRVAAGDCGARLCGLRLGARLQAPRGAWRRSSRSSRGRRLGGRAPRYRGSGGPPGAPRSGGGGGGGGPPPPPPPFPPPRRGQPAGPRDPGVARSPGPQRWKAVGAKVAPLLGAGGRTHAGPASGWAVPGGGGSGSTT